MEDEIIVNHSKYIEISRIVDAHNGLIDRHDGVISVAESQKNIPFEIKRVYYIYDLNNPEAIRGKHAHKKLEQVLFCISGSCRIGLDDGTTKQTIVLDKPNKGIYLGVELWHTMQEFSDHCILLVLASDYYNPSDYIRDYDEFVKYIGQDGSVQ